MLKYLLQKEFTQIKRNKFLPRMVVGMPLMAILIFPLVANFNIKNINLSVVDNNHSNTSERLIEKVTSSGYFRLSNVSDQYPDGLKSVELDESDVVMEIPPQFEKDLITTQKANILISANAVNGMKGGLGSAYLLSILDNISNEIRDENGMITSKYKIPNAEIIPTYNFNPHLEYKYTMIPAIMMMLLMMVCGFLPALNIVNEKEHGTLEQLNVTPVTKFNLILSKLIPYWIIGFIVISIGFLVAWIFYGMTSAGGYLTIYLFAAVFILAISGFGLLISGFANTVQQAMFIMFFFVISFIFLSGLYTPVTSMPDWLQVFSQFSPLRYMVETLRYVFLKGSTPLDLWKHFFALLGFAIFFNGMAVLTYRKSS